jgi:hypothetical protein
MPASELKRCKELEEESNKKSSKAQPEKANSRGSSQGKQVRYQQGMPCIIAW